MIFVTVGAQLPFDRLVRVVDAWAGETGRTDVFGQIANGERPTHMGWADFLEPEDYRKRVIEAEVVVAHAGMGSIITALEFERPIVVLPRLGDLGETRNDHQVATGRRLAEQGLVTATDNEAELRAQLDNLDAVMAQHAERAGTSIGDRASDGILDSIRGFLDDIG
ncbi:MAG: glycosyltransferase [Planctomycetota bacterium]